MRRLTGSPFLMAAIIVTGCLATGCAGGSGPISSFSPSRTATAAVPSKTATALPTKTATALPTQSAAATATAGPTVTTTAAAPAPAAQPSSSPAAASGTNSAVIWPWILLAVIVLTGLIVLISRASGRRSKRAAGWQSRVVDAYAQGSALHDAMSVAEAPGGMAAGDAAVRWSDIQRRADNLTQTLYALREAAPDEASRVLVADSLASLQAVRSAMDAERSPMGAGAEQAAVVRGRLSSFEASLRALRSPDERVG